jgi:hypothetical protein
MPWWWDLVLAFTMTSLMFGAAAIVSSFRAYREQRRELQHYVLEILRKRPHQPIAKLDLWDQVLRTPQSRLGYNNFCRAMEQLVDRGRITQLLYEGEVWYTWPP